LTLYAHWRATQYTIHFSPNGGVGSFPDFVGSIGDTVNLPTSAAFTRQYFTLLGFDALANAVVPTFTGSSFVLTADIIEALFTPYQTPDRTEATLYAIWSENEAYTVSYNGNGNTGGIAPVDTAGNASPGSNAYYINSLVVCLDKGTLVKAGYTFQGWALTKAAADAGTVAIKPGEDFIIVGDVEFFAVWKKNPPTPTKPAMPKTGDVSAVAQWLSVLGISASALVAYAVTSKRRKDEGLQ